MWWSLLYATDCTHMIKMLSHVIFLSTGREHINSIILINAMMTHCLSMILILRITSMKSIQMNFEIKETSESDISASYHDILSTLTITWTPYCIANIHMDYSYFPVYWVPTFRHRLLMTFWFPKSWYTRVYLKHDAFITRARSILSGLCCTTLKSSSRKISSFTVM